jgi:hypothetical protein
MFKGQDKRDGVTRTIKALENGFFVFFKKEEWETRSEKCPDGYGPFRGAFYQDLETLKKDYSV